MRRPDNRSGSVHDIPRPSYVQRLSVQLPHKNVTDATLHDNQDVLCLVIHVEESQSNNGSRADVDNINDRFAAVAGSKTDGSPTKKRPTLKNIGRQRSASMETLINKCATPCPKESTPTCSPSSLRRASSLYTPQPAKSPATSSSVSGSVVKELRRSSELLRNILLSISSRRSSESSCSVKESYNLFLSGNAVESSDLQVALQNHRKRLWIANQPQAAAAESIAQAKNYNLNHLFQAVTSNNIEQIRCILDSGHVDPNTSNESGYTVLHWCSVQTPLPWPSILELLQYGSRTEQRDQEGTQPVFLVPNLSQLQAQLVTDAVDYLRGFFHDLRHEEVVGNGGLSAQRPAANIFRRLQQGATRNKQQQQQQQQQNPQISKNKSREVDSAESGYESYAAKVSISLFFNACKHLYSIVLPCIFFSAT